VIQNALRKAFAPEFLNRMDDMIMFKSLDRTSIHSIIDLELNNLFKRINDLGYSISVTEKAKDFIVDKGYDEKFGARPLKRAIQKYIEDPLAEEIIKSNLQEGDTISLDIEDGATELKTSIEKGAKSKKKKE
jgi:ATP-dependent Clp protease ATP-binding subunit ClpC